MEICCVSLVLFAVQLQGGQDRPEFGFILCSMSQNMCSIWQLVCARIYVEYDSLFVPEFMLNICQVVCPRICVTRSKI